MIDRVLLSILAVVIIAISFLLGQRHGYKTGKEDSTVLNLNVNQIIEVERKKFVDKYLKTELTEEVREQMNKDIKDIANKVSSLIKKNYGDSIIVDSSINGCLVYKGRDQIIDITEVVKGEIESH